MPFFYFLIFTISITSSYGQNTEKNGAIKKPRVGISLHSGFFRINGDVDGNGLGHSIKVQMPLHTIFSLRANVFYGSAKGLNDAPWVHAVYGGGLVETFYEPYRNQQEGWYPSYRTNQSIIEVEGLFSLMKTVTKVLDIKIDNFDFYVLGSFGIFGKKTSLDLLDQNGLPYVNMVSRASSGLNNDIAADRKKIKENIRGIYDGKYETDFNYKGLFTHSYGAGFSMKITQLLSLGLEHKRIFYPNVDYLDGIRFRTGIDQTLMDDKSSFTNVFFMMQI
ncbi:MAG: hypothetical protein IPN86_22870 [Saprospiraceae bacterium]|nr:hypothetical protein [Saprospiraceae bacterium]